MGNAKRKCYHERFSKNLGDFQLTFPTLNEIFRKLSSDKGIIALISSNNQEIANPTEIAESM